ncbi:glutathione S-transferase family protein [Sphingosinicella sp. BN140058]|uniref:glutathione S-transferase family protein n=1 Tax=Sphingosinicella sp. BN140058 TaxID=1892855 RepID=UPI0010102028|nr:glutathione S-transferase family protein [Sphingosinicella sp. BN140058]QAY76027.1 glutathione S-transferase family protein [Sphingosinicella sp. BN140058]
MMDSNRYVLFGVKGWGSAITEAQLELCQAPYELVEVDGFDTPSAARDRLLAYNPLAQVPTLVLPDGVVMRESAAIALLLSERHPQAGLAPPTGSAERPFFLRWLVWLVANVYPTFTFADYPERWVRSEREDFAQAVGAYRRRLWQQLEAELGEGPWTLGERFSVLDVYLGVMTHWRPRRAWFAQNCRRIHAIALGTDAHPVLGPVLQRNFGDA